MGRTATRPPASQLSMPGMPAPVSLHKLASCSSVMPGQEVLYVGRIDGGPRYGTRGVVKEALRRKALVDMGHMGTWHIPYFFLAIPRGA
jgi:hypothetical protein